ncbi:Tll0287-like domain-containing protein [Glaciecola sp. 1036]|uniref:Tll0287-like domain-containing protein n=1 Tax=Alteromonadaceae TaxID=72275 RepID=UPI003D078CA9
MTASRYIAPALLLVYLNVSAQQPAEGSDAISLAEKPALTDAEIVNEQEALALEGKMRISKFAETLKHTLVTTIQTQGLTAAVEVCHQEAPKIADKLSTHGWQLARTSLKTRNQANQPDDWETQNLIAFDKSFKSGAAPDTLMVTSIQDNQFRMMKAIPTGQVCLACHGTSISEEVRTVIHEKYPKDAATGFTLEDIRGAFTLTKDL